MGDSATMTHGPNETLLTGTTAEKVKAAALAADPGSRFAHLLRTGLEEALV